MRTDITTEKCASSVSPRDLGQDDGLRQRWVRLLRGVIEAVTLLMVCLSPWALGAAEPAFEFYLYAALGLVLALWAARILLEWKLSWKKCPVAVCLAALFAIGIWQVAPLPKGMLTSLSPATVQLYARLLPAEPELLPFGATREAVFPSPGSTISLYPAATRHEMIKLLAVFLLFTAVRNNCATVPALRRLSVAALFNGAALALFGLIQFFTSPHNTLYWTYPSTGQVFGPFICHNHFAFYVNLCIGLGFGLLIQRGFSGAGWSRRGRRSCGWGGKLGTVLTRSPASGFGAACPAQGHFPSPLALLRDTQAPWICGALAFMLSSVVFCLSRGGFLALLGGSTLCFASTLKRPARSTTRPGAVLLAVAMALALLGWFGFDQVEARLATLWKGDSLQSRLPLWFTALRLVPDFPLWGTGYGTFAYVEPLQRTSSGSENVIFDHAHNEYLEALVEGGVIRLFVSLLTVGLVFRSGHRAVRHAGLGAGGLALGAFFGFGTMAVHSFGEFGLHLPAVAVLATVLCAHVCSLGDADQTAGQNGAAPVGSASGFYSLRVGGLAPLLGAGAAVTLGLVICGEGWRASEVQRLRYLALRPGNNAYANGSGWSIACLEAGAHLAPEYARLQAELAQAHLVVFEQRMEEQEMADAACDAAQAILVPACASLPLAPTHPILGSAASSVFASAAQKDFARGEQDELSHRHLVPALRHYLQARDLCPLLGKPHVRLAAYVDRLVKAEPRSNYLERAKLLDPSDAELWYLCGIEELLDGRPDLAWKNWRRCLELSELYVAGVIERSTRLLGASEILERVFPERPELLLAAARQLSTMPEAAGLRRAFLEKALVLLEERPGSETAEDLHTKALLQTCLGRPAEALASYERALAREPRQVNWRYEFAKCLYQQGSFQKARRELAIVLAQQPSNSEARELLQLVARRIAEAG